MSPCFPFCCFSQSRTETVKDFLVGKQVLMIFLTPSSYFGIPLLLFCVVYGGYFEFSKDTKHKKKGGNYFVPIIAESCLNTCTQYLTVSIGFRLLVGAPTAQTEQPGVARGGSVFRCSTEIPDQCQSIPFDVTGKDFNSFILIVSY